MSIQVFVYNYGLFSEAFDIFNEFTVLGYDTYLINCECPKDPPFSETKKIKKFPNIYYSGQWNETLKLLTGDVAFILSSDIKINNKQLLMRKMERFYHKFENKAAIYAPNVWWTPWTYNPALLEDVGNGCKKVMSTDSMIWSLRSDLAFQVGPMDLSLNKIGWGIELLASWHAMRDNRLVVRDYSIKVQHPCSSAYDRNKADREFRTMISKMPIEQKDDFWQHYNSRHKYQFGWNGNDELKSLPKML